MALASPLTLGRIHAVQPRFLLISLAGTILASCAVENDHGHVRQESPAFSENARIKDRVLTILCGNDTQDLQQDLTPVVNDARERDGRSDRVWEVADNADCQELERNSSQTG